VPERIASEGIRFNNYNVEAQHPGAPARARPVPTILTPEALRLQHAPIADCARYDRLRRAS
jgi:hypothetical protein